MAAILGLRSADDPYRLHEPRAIGERGFASRSFKNTGNLFIHIARIPIGDSPRVHPNIFKMSLPFASSEGVSASGVRYQSDGVQDTHLLPHSLSTRIRERMCDLALTHSHSPFAYFAYISSYSLLIILSKVL